MSNTSVFGVVSMMEHGTHTPADSIGSRRIMSVIGAANVVQKRLGTTAHVTPQLPCALVAMQYMQTASIS
jgi:hypothetical protein